MIISLRVPRLVKAIDRVEKIARPANEKNRHEPVAGFEEMIDRPTVLRGIWKNPECFVDTKHNVRKGC